MGTTRPYGTETERAERRRQVQAMLSTEGRERIRHCWVQPEPRYADETPPTPGLVIAWARSGGMWMARVVHLWGDSSVVETWYPYTRLIPVENPLPFFNRRRSR